MSLLGEAESGQDKEIASAQEEEASPSSGEI